MAADAGADAEADAGADAGAGTTVPADGPQTGGPPFRVLLRRHRLAAGLTQEALAARAGLSVRGVQDLERGARATPQRETVRLLTRALGLAPGSAAALAASVSRARRAPAGGSRPARAASAAPDPPAPAGLPRPLTSFVGREREVRAVRGRLRNPGVRLLTLTGPGGVGKTRLALRAAGAAAADFADGACYVDLAPLREAGLVAAALAQALGLRESAGRGLPECLADHLRPKRLLLVLDNCEHLTDGVAPLVPELLRGCLLVKVLATSRAPLRLSGEHRFAVPPLSLPDAGRPPPPDGLLRYEAPALFVQRAVAARADFAVTPETAPAVAEVCRRLDGLPLAIELAAARVALLPPRALLARLDRRLALLTGGARDAPARQHSLRDTISWSYDLLTGPEQALFARLSVFAGGWTLEAAEAVCGDDEGPASDDPSGGSSGLRPPSTGLRRGVVLDALARLVEQSLVEATADDEGHVRYRLLETLREYAGQRLADSGQAETFRERHAGYIVAYVEAAARELQGPTQRAWLDRLGREHDNSRAALRWLLDRPTSAGVEQGLRLVGALFGFWATRGPRQEARSWLAAFLALPGPRRPTVARAKALYRAAVVAHWFGDVAAKRAWLEECAAVVREAEDPRAAAWALRSLGDMANRRGDTEETAARLTQSLSLFRQANDDQETAWTLSLLGASSKEAGDYAGARRYLAESLAVYRRLGDLRHAATQLHRLGLTVRAAGDAAAARPLNEEALSIWQDLGYENGIAGSLNVLGEDAAAAGDVARAAPLFAAALERYRSQGFHDGAAMVSRNLARLAWVEGDTTAVRTWLAAALGIWTEADGAHRVAETLEVFAGLAATHEQPARALHLAGPPAARAAAGRPLSARRRTALDAQLEPARRALGAGAAVALSRGQELSLDEAIAEAVAAAPPGTPAPRAAPVSSDHASVPAAGGPIAARPGPTGPGRRRPRPGRGR